MEENTINLGNVVNAQQNVETLTGVVNSTTVVTDNATIVAESSNVVVPSDGISLSNTDVTTTVVSDSVDPVVIAQPTTQLETVVTEPTVQDATNGYKLKTESLVKLVNNARKAAICNDMLVLTTVFQLKFGKDGFEIVGTDSENIIVQKDTSVSFNKEAVLCVSADLFTKLINKLDTEFVTIEIDEAKRLVTVKSNGEFILSEVYDIATGQSIYLDTNAMKMDMDVVRTIDLTLFKNKLKKAQMLNIGNTTYNTLCGVYCTDKIYSTDRSNMYGEPNIPELVNDEFYLSSSFVELLISTDMEGTATFSIKNDNEGNAKGIMITTNNMCLYGPTGRDSSQYPVQVLSDYINKDFNNHFKVSTKRLISVLEKAQLFLSAGDTEKQSCNFELDVQSQSLKVKSISKASEQIVPIQELDTAIQPFNLHIESVIKILKNCNEDEVTVKVDNVEYKTVRFITDDRVQIVSIINL